MPIFALLLVVIPALPAELLLEHFGLLSERDTVTPPNLMAELVVPFGATGLAVLAWTRLVERRSFASIGLSPEGLGPWIGGVLTGFATISAVVLAIWLAGGLRLGQLAPALGSLQDLGLIALLLPCFVLQAGVEELLFRGWALSSGARRLPIWLSVVLSSAVFTLLHYSRGQTWLTPIGIFLFAVFACCWALKARNIWGVMGWHAGWNWLLCVGFQLPVTGLDAHLPALIAQFTPVGPAWLHGGAQGPEASVYASVFFVIACAFWLWRSRRAPPP